MKYIVMVPNIDYDTCYGVEYYTTDSEKEAQDLALATNGFYQILEERDPPEVYDVYTASVSLISDWFVLNHTKNILKPSEQITIPIIEDIGFYSLYIDGKSNDPDILEKVKAEKEKILKEHQIISAGDYFGNNFTNIYVKKSFLDKNNGIINYNNWGTKYKLDFNTNECFKIEEKYYLDGKEVLPTASGLPYHIEKNWIKI